MDVVCYALKMAKENNVKYIRLQFTDMLGTVKNVEIPFTNLEKAINSNFDYKTQAQKDLEFLNYRENEKFISLTK